MIPQMRAVLLVSGLALAASMPASYLAAQSPSKPDPRAEIARKIPGVKADDLRPSPIPGVFELTRGTEIAYISNDGKYAITGDLIDLSTSDNLSEKHRRDARVKLLSSFPETQMLTFAPKNPKYTVTVFTDIDCGYCRKLHSQIAEYNRLGIGVHYLFYPRSGPGTDSWKKAEQVWCSPNRNEALTRAKRGEALSAKACASSPVARHYDLGQSFDIRGTPAIVTSKGEMLPGYVEPAVLAQHLQPAAR
jgi:thiol:disulfide interchange protein DsbC